MRPAPAALGRQTRRQKITVTQAPPADQLKDILAKARPLCLEAGQKILALLNTDLIKSRKADHSLVTNADHASNDVILAGLKKYFPDHAVISEETGLDGSAGAEFLWLIDPLDGTKAFARGQAGFSVMAGLLYQGTPVLGIVYDPLEGSYYEAARGAGATFIKKSERQTVRVSDRKDWPRMPVITSVGFSEKLKETVTRAFPVPFSAPINSVGVKVGYMVRQFADIYINHHPVHFWDTAGPLVILEEAGGVMTEWDGSPLRYDDLKSLVHPLPTIASNNLRHGELVGFLKTLSR
jgi:3'(2'),5'-bisphosphate nucleotidase